MRAGLIGTGAISRKRAEADRNIGYKITVRTNTNAARGRKFAAEIEVELVPAVEELCLLEEVDSGEVCTHFPPTAWSRSGGGRWAAAGKHLLMQKPIATRVETARFIVELAREARFQFFVVSQHRFEDSIRFLKTAITGGRLGKILEAGA
jgi:predicted dehydrogenase